MIFQQINESIITPALSELPERFDSPEARVMLLAIGHQESGLTERVQRPIRPGAHHGPARGLWQFESGGGVVGVMRHRASATRARDICTRRGVKLDAHEIHAALAEDDILACVFARLLLFTDPEPLPGIGARLTAWDYYLRNWRPGRPHPNRWAMGYDRAVETVRASND